MTAIVSLALATAAFVGSHFLLSHPLRPALVARLGETGFLRLYSLIAFATLGWMIFAGTRIEEAEPAWIAPLWWWRIASALMLLASILLVGSLIRNPALPHPGARPKAIPAPAGVFAITRHPMNWAFMLWALVHLSLWGSSRNLIIAAGILILALFGSIGQDRKKLALLGQSWRDWQARTSFVPFAALLAGRVPWRAAAPGWIALIGGLALWLAITWYHAPMVSPVGGLGRGPLGAG
ncbi:MAG TPA: NnrU family protein [Allosphingosinicella sp.]|nr:NnrU family protein [Allosphingosinicella sp.]